jgi:hypothetical protein
VEAFTLGAKVTVLKTVPVDEAAPRGMVETIAPRHASALATTEVGTTPVYPAPLVAMMLATAPAYVLLARALAPGAPAADP